MTITFRTSNNDNSDGNKNKKPTSVLSFLVQVFCMVVLMWKMVDISKELNTAYGLIFQDVTNENNNAMLPALRPQNVCPSTKHLFLGNILAAVQAAEDFHMHGGNLKQIQECLDQQIDFTYQRLGVDYFQKSLGEQVKTGRIDQAIHEELVKGDTNSRGGYDQQQLPGAFHPSTHKLASRHVNVMEEMNFDKWEAALGPIGPNCTSVDRIQQRAKEHYEDKFMCSFHNLSSASASQQEDKCHMLSIGSNDQWGFESTVLKHAPHCHTHTFDCTLTTPKHKPNTPNATFYLICIAGEDRDDPDTGRKHCTYDSMWKMTGMKGPPRLLKMDVEGFEYDVLSSMMPRLSSMLSLLLLSNGGHHLPEQIVVELHYASCMYNLPWLLRSRQASEISMLISHMYQAGGYLPVHVDYNPGCAPCLEVLFVKVLCQ